MLPPGSPGHWWPCWVGSNDLDTLPGIITSLKKEIMVVQGGHAIHVTMTILERAQLQLSRWATLPAGATLTIVQLNIERAQLQLSQCWASVGFHWMNPCTARAATTARAVDVSHASPVQGFETNRATGAHVDRRTFWSTHSENPQNSENRLIIYNDHCINILKLYIVQGEFYLQLAFTCPVHSTRSGHFLCFRPPTVRREDL